VITRHPLLDRRECEDIRGRLPDHPALARQRNPERPGSFVIYGRAAYIDAAPPHSEPERDYHAMVGLENRRLEAMLGDLYPRLQSRLELVLGDPVAYAPELLALPGLHVFRGEGIAAASRSGNHFDLQFQFLRFPTARDEVEPISVTLPLRLPPGGSGLRIFSLTQTDFLRAHRMGLATSTEELAARKPSVYEEYEVGTMVVHRGLYLHGIEAPRQAYAADEERITLQCHGIRAGGTWYVYW
jgi:hypothetical protein